MKSFLPLLFLGSCLSSGALGAAAAAAGRARGKDFEFDFTKQPRSQPDARQQVLGYVNADDGYTQSELKRNAILEKLGLPIEPPKARQREQGAGSSDDGVSRMSQFSDVGHETFASKGYIGIHRESTSGPLIGYLDCHRLVPSKEDATLYAFIRAGPVMEVRVVGTQYRLAVTAGPLGIDLAPYSKNFHLPRHTLFSSIPGSGHDHDKLQAYLFETSVFRHIPDGDEIEVQWVNDNGQYATVEIALMDGRIYFTGDIRAFSTYTSRRVDHVEFKWYPVV